MWKDADDKHNWRQESHHHNRDNRAWSATDLRIDLTADEVNEFDYPIDSLLGSFLGDNNCDISEGGDGSGNLKSKVKTVETAVAISSHDEFGGTRLKFKGAAVQLTKKLPTYALLACEFHNHSGSPVYMGMSTVSNAQNLS